MMITNATITIYNRKRGDKDTYDTWNRTVLRDVHVYIDHKTALTESGLKECRCLQDPYSGRSGECGSVPSTGRIREVGNFGRILDNPKR